MGAARSGLKKANEKKKKIGTLTKLIWIEVLPPR